MSRTRNQRKWWWSLSGKAAARGTSECFGYEFFPLFSSLLPSGRNYKLNQFYREFNLAHGLSKWLREETSLLAGIARLSLLEPCPASVKYTFIMASYVISERDLLEFHSDRNIYLFLFHMGWVKDMVAY
jgi:hypothetical protein